MMTSQAELSAFASEVPRPRTLSVVVLTYNEAHRLRPCLESVAWADEIIAVDGFSTDGTVALAREFTSHVYLSDLLGPKNPGGYSDQRNFALSKAKGDWVLFVDADERVTPDLRAQIEGVLHAPGDDTAAYRVSRLDYYFGVPTRHIHGPGWQTRLLRRERCRYNDNRVHEGVVCDGPCRSLPGTLLHYSKDTVAQYIDTMNRYTSLEAEQRLQRGLPLARSPWPGMGRQFVQWYFYERGYRDGRFGLLVSLLYVFYSYLTWAKHWELSKSAERVAEETRPGRMTAAYGGLLSGLWHLLKGRRKETL